MSPLKIGGKSQGDPVPPPKHPAMPRIDPTPVDVPMDWDDPYKDPFPEPDVSDPQLAASWLADMGIYAQQLVSEVAALARKADRLNKKLADPKLADSPNRPKAVQRSRTMDTDLINLIRDAAWHEAHADRTWAALTPRQRRHADAAAHWMTEPTATRLIGRTWAGIGAFETFPRFFRIRRAWFQDFPFLLITDMRDAGLWGWKPSGADPPDPFGGETFFSATLAQELDGRR